MRLPQPAADRCDVSMAVEFLNRLLQELDPWNHVRGSVAMGFGYTSEQTHAFEITCRSNKLHLSARAMSSRPVLRREWDPTIPHAIQPCAADPDRADVDFGKDLDLGEQSRSQLKVIRFH